MGGLVSDIEALMDYLKVKDSMFVGLSIGGMIGQGLATKRRDLIRSMVLSNTAAKIATPDIWRERIASIRENGMDLVADPLAQYAKSNSGGRLYRLCPCNCRN